MRTEGKVSKVAICEKCGCYIKAGHIDYLDKKSEKEFTELTNEGFTVKLETIKTTQKRKIGFYEDCISNNCKTLKQ